MKKRIILICVIVLVAVLILLVVLLKDKNVKEGRYVLENGKNKDVVLVIQEDNKYSFGASTLSSGSGVGTYKIDGKYLICTEESSDNVYKFEIVNSKKLVILTEESSEISEPGTKYKLQDGDIFILE